MLPAPDGTRRDRPPISRSGDRRLTAVGILVSAGLLVAAIVSILLPVDVRREGWLPLHLALAGAATVAIGSVLPFFLAALAATRPADLRLRVVTIAALAFGVGGVTVGVAAGIPGLATAGGILFVAGVVALGVLLVRILGGALGPQRGLLPRAYAWAIGSVAVGGSLATSNLAGLPPVVDAWDRLKPAHAWLNVYGFLALTIATTLVHFYPTVVGSRIGLRPSVRVALGGLAIGPAAIALGDLLVSDLLARAGAVAVVVGTLGLVRFVAVAHAARFAWTTDFAWHRFTTWSLAAAVGWFVCGAELAAVPVLALGAVPAAWELRLVGAPIVVGFVLQVLVGSWTHLLPAIGPGGPAAHARQRAILGTAATARLAALNLGAALLSLGLAGELGSAATLLVAIGGILAAVPLGAAVVLLVGAVVLGRDPTPEPAGE